MKIVHFDQMFHPEFGDQINILPKYQVKQGHDVYIVTGKSDVPHPRFKYFADNSNMDAKDTKYQNDTGVKIIRIDIKRFISGRAVYKRGYKKLIDSLNPDILFCHFNDTIVGMHYAWISNKLNYPVVFDSHMLEMASVNPFNKIFRLLYRLFLTPKIRKRSLKVIRTQDDNYVNKNLGIPKELTPFISFGSDTSLFHPDNSVKIKYREKNNIGENDFVVVYAGQLTESKGAKLLASAFEEKIGTLQNIVLVVIGNADGQFGLEVESLFEGSENRIIRFPTQKYVDLPSFYQMADLCVFPKQCSLSFYDAQACGLPVLAEDNNINISRLNYNNGLVYKTQNIDDFRDKILYFKQLSTLEYRKVSQNAHNYVKDNYDYEYIAKQYTELLVKERMRFKEGERSQS